MIGITLVPNLRIIPVGLHLIPTNPSTTHVLQVGAFPMVEIMVYGHRQLVHTTNLFIHMTVLTKV